MGGGRHQQRRSDHLTAWRFSVFSVSPGINDSDVAGETMISDEITELQQIVKSVLLDFEEGLLLVGNGSTRTSSISEWLLLERHNDSYPTGQTPLSLVSNLPPSPQGTQPTVEASQVEATLFADVVEMVVVDLCQLYLQSQGVISLKCRSERHSQNTISHPFKSSSQICIRQNPWNLASAIQSLATPEAWPNLSEKGAWNFNQRILKRIVALSCASGSSTRDKIVNRCSMVFASAVALFHRIVELSRPSKPIGYATTSSDASSASLPSFSSSENISTTPCMSVSERQWPHEQASSIISEPTSQSSSSIITSSFRECLRANISDDALVAVLDYSFHAVGLSTSLNDTNNNISNNYNNHLSNQRFWLASSAETSTREQESSCLVEHSLSSTDVKCILPDLLRSALDVASGDHSVVVLVSGASGCGKSTLSCLLANRLGLGTVLSTDTIRHILRSVYSKNENPLLYASTYETGKYVAEEALSHCGSSERTSIMSKDLFITPHTQQNATSLPESVLERRRCVEGYLQQSEMLYDRLEFIITQLMASGESLVVEGVHLTNNFIQRIENKFPGQCVPFLVYLSNEDTHVDRFASRSKNFNTEPTKNKYVEYLENIRTIQRYLKQQAETESHSITLIDNSSISAAIRLMHGTVVGCLTKRSSI